MNTLFEQGNSYIQTITPYQAGTPIEEVERQLGISNIIKLASNENPLGPSPKALYAANQILNNVHIYPDASYFRLRFAIANYNNTDINNITVGNGSENCIDILAKAFLNQYSNVIVDQYCFATIRIVIKSYNAKEVVIPSLDYRLDNKQMVNQIDNNTKMIFVVNPNNPTGTFTTKHELEYLLANTPNSVIVVIDEAYHEYVDHEDYPHTISLLKKYPNLVISRTFSKVFGLAGIRLGYLISSPEVSELLHRSRLPFNVSACAVEAGIGALSDHKFIELTKENNKTGMAYLSYAFEKLNIEYIPSVANFITINTKTNATNVYNKLLQMGIIVRPLVPYGLPHHLRITIGTPTQNETLISCLKEALNV